MKKFLCIVLALAAIVVFTYAESTFTDYLKERIGTVATEDLMASRALIEEELAKREADSGWKIVVPGVYSVGTDLPEGAYEVRLLSCFLTSGDLYVFDTEEAYNDYATNSGKKFKYDVSLSMYTKGTPTRIVLDEEDVLCFRPNGTYLMRPAEAKLF